MAPRLAVPDQIAVGHVKEAFDENGQLVDENLSGRLESLVESVMAAAKIECMTMESSTPSTPFFTDTYGSSYRLVEPGTFLLGDEHGTEIQLNNLPAPLKSHNPSFSESVQSQAFWLDVMGENPSKFQEG